MHCDANAYCLLIPETSDFKCECKPGYNGTGTVCTDVCLGFCDNEGVCLKDSRGQPSCRCSGSFTGKHCTEKSEFFYITGGIAGGVILIIIVVLLVWMICVRLVKKTRLIYTRDNDRICDIRRLFDLGIIRNFLTMLFKML